METWAKNVADAMGPWLIKIAILIALIIAIILCMIFKVVGFWTGVFLIGLTSYSTVIFIHIKYKTLREHSYHFTFTPIVLMCISSYFIYKNFLISLGVAAVLLLGVFIMRKQSKALVQNKIKEAQKNKLKHK